MKKGVLITLILILLAALAASAIYLGSYFLEGKREEDAFKELSNKVETARQEASTAPTEESTEAATEEETTVPAETESPYGTPGISGNAEEYYTPDVVDEPENVPEKPELNSGSDFLPWYQELHQENPDMVGWLKIEDTKIDYPVMQTDEENANFYLYKDFQKNSSVRGCIYAREQCDVFAPSDNITLFGHNMKDGSMFAALGKYYDKSVWENNPMVFFDTLTESHVYKIFAVFKTSGTDDVGFGYHLVVDAKDEAEFNEFIATCKQLSFYDTGITPVYGDKILCLSTCEYTIDNGRFVIAAVRIT